MKILEHFDKFSQNGLIIYRLKDVELDAFLNKLTDDFRICYIRDSDLDELAKKNGTSPSDSLEKFILPDIGNIKSGDFGEMLSFFSVIESYEKKGIQLYGPRKWRWKDRNKAAQYTDCVLFHISNPKKYTKKDLLVTIESKMKAVPSKKHRIQDAIDGAMDDKLSRMAKTLIWLEEKYARLGMPKQKSLVERFKDPATHGSYSTLHKAIAILDKDLETEETTKSFDNPEGVTVVVFSIKELQKAYERTRVNVIQSV